MAKWYHWKDASGYYFRTEGPFVPHEPGLKSVSEMEYVREKLREARETRQGSET